MASKVDLIECSGIGHCKVVHVLDALTQSDEECVSRGQADRLSDYIDRRDD